MNSYEASIQMAPFEALYGRNCRSQDYWDNFREVATLGFEFITQTRGQVKMIREKFKATQDR